MASFVWPACLPGELGDRRRDTLRRMRLIDLSMPIVASPESTPELLRTEIQFADHAAGAAEIKEMFGVGSELLRNGEGWALETFTRLGTHNSTHVDAPYHYNSLIASRPAQTIDQLPLDWFFRPGVVLDFHDRADGQTIDVDGVEAALTRAGHELVERDIVLIRTGRDVYYSEPDYMQRGPGVSAAATHWLYDRGVRVMGIDAWGWDRPLHLQAEEALATGRSGIFWTAHQADLPYSQIERLANLDRLPPSGFTVACFPLRLIGGSAAPARVVAILDEGHKPPEP
jgi:kynurenine formamidase